MKLLGNDALNKSTLLVNNMPNFIANRLLLEFVGTNLAGQTLAVADLGQLQINTQKFGQIGFINISDLLQINNMYAGVPRTTSVIGAGFNFSMFYPFHALPADENSLYVNKDWLLNIQIQGFNNAKVSSGTFNVCYKETLFPQNYIPYITFIDRTVSTGTQDKFTVEKDNMYNILVYNNTAVLGNISIVKDGTQVINSTFTELESELNLELMLETFISNYALIDLNPTKEKYERLADSVEMNVTVTTGGTYRAIIIGSIDNELTNELRKNSRSTIESVIFEKARVASKQNKLGDVQALADSLGMATAELLTKAGIVK
jgi:hypothetical protein